MKKTKGTEIPKFKSLEEEREYWEARGLLAEGHKGTINKPKTKQKRSSFLALRLTGEELTRLRDVAAKQGLGPSTYARKVITTAIERQGQADTASLTEIINQMDDLMSKLRIKKEEALAKKSN